MIMFIQMLSKMSFLEILYNATHHVDMGLRQEKESEENLCPAIEPVVSKRKSIANEKLVPELAVLANEFGELKERKQIEVELNRLLELLPRQRKKSDAYKGIKSELKKMGVELIITSKTKKK